MGMQSLDFDDIILPCSDCYITSFQAGLEYVDGTYANANTSMWLHHAVILNPNRKDASCSTRANATERVFAAGNERSFIDLTLNGWAAATPPHGSQVSAPSWTN